MEIRDDEGLEIELRYNLTLWGTKYHIEVTRLTQTTRLLAVDGKFADLIRTVERKLAGGTFTVFKADSIARTYYDDVEQAAEAVATKRHKAAARKEPVCEG